MATINTGTYYRFKSKLDNKYLNILTDDPLDYNMNVTTYSLSSTDTAQIWLAQQYSYDYSTKFLLKSKKNESFVLDRWRGSDNYNNADIYTVGTTLDDLNDQVVSFEYSGNYCRIKLANRSNLYLTVSSASTYGGHNVVWAAATGGDNQLWTFETVGTSSNDDIVSSALVEDLNQNNFGNQTGTNTFCYATCVLAILRRYKGTSFTMDRLISEGIVNGSDGAVNSRDTTYYSITSNISINDDYSDICNEIEAGRPVIIYGQSSVSGHYVVADSFSSRTASGIIVMDPWKGTHVKMTESTLKTYTHYRKYTNK